MASLSISSPEDFMTSRRNLMLCSFLLAESITLLPSDFMAQEIGSPNESLANSPHWNRTSAQAFSGGFFNRELSPVEEVPVTEEYLRSRIENGGEKMPSYSHIKEPQRSALIAYLKTL